MKKLVGLTGLQCSGKDTVADIFKGQFGYTGVTSSVIVRDYIRDNELGDPTRPLLNSVARELRAEEPGRLIRESLERSKADKVVISGLYCEAEAQYFVDLGGVILNCTATREVRYQRALERMRVGDDIDFATFCTWEESDAKSEGLVSQSVNKVGELAVAEIVNNSDHDTLIANTRTVVVALNLQ